METYLARGVHFTMGYPAISLYSLGPIAMLVELALSSTFLALLSIYIVRLIDSGTVVRSIIAFQFLLWAYSAYTQGDLWRLFTVKALTAITVLLFVEALVQGRNQTASPVYCSIGKRDGGAMG